MADKYVKRIAKKDKEAIINTSVQALSNRPTSNATEMKKRFVKPIVNEDGEPSIAVEVDRIAQEADKAIEDINNAKGQPNGIATLDASGRLSPDQIPYGFGSAGGDGATIVAGISKELAEEIAEEKASKAKTDAAEYTDEKIEEVEASLKEEIANADFVKQNQYPKAGKAGIVFADKQFGITSTEGGLLMVNGASNDDINKRTAYKPITTSKLDDAVKEGIVNNQNALNEAEKAKAKEWLGITESSSGGGGSGVSASEIEGIVRDFVNGLTVDAVKDTWTFEALNEEEQMETVTKDVALIERDGKIIAVGLNNGSSGGSGGGVSEEQVRTIATNIAQAKADDALADAKAYVKTNVTDKKGAKNGFASLDATGKVPTSQLPDNIGNSNVDLSELAIKASVSNKTLKVALTNGNSASVQLPDEYIKEARYSEDTKELILQRNDSKTTQVVVGLPILTKDEIAKIAEDEIKNTQATARREDWEFEYEDENGEVAEETKSIAVIEGDGGIVLAGAGGGGSVSGDFEDRLQDVEEQVEGVDEALERIIEIQDTLINEGSGSVTVGGGTKLYRHTIYQEEEGGYPTNITTAVSLRKTPYTSMQEVSQSFQNGEILSMITGGFRVLDCAGTLAYIADANTVYPYNYYLLSLKTDTVTEL